jgi:hypothetical protein
MCVDLILISPILEARAEICLKLRLLFGQWSFNKNCFWDLLTFKAEKILVVGILGFVILLFAFAFSLTKNGVR